MSPRADDQLRLVIDLGAARLTHPLELGDPCEIIGRLAPLIGARGSWRVLQPGERA